MERSTNALKELADFLAKEAVVNRNPEFMRRAIASFGEDSWTRYLEHKAMMRKAARVVAELSKVEDIKVFGVVHVREDMAIDAVENCRAIAEEGVK